MIFIIFHFFSRRNPSLPYTCTATIRIFDDSAHFYLSHNGMLKKGRPKTSPAIKTFAEHNKVFARLLGKAAPSRARSSCRAPQSAKSPIGVFFLIDFSFAPVYAKEKADRDLTFYFGC